MRAVCATKTVGRRSFGGDIVTQLLTQAARALLAVVMLTSLALAGEDAAKPEDAWQAVVTTQIEAFRSGDAATAFGIAAAPFHAAFGSAEEFYAVIAGSGYGPLVTSVSHDFGTFERPDERTVLQVVNIQGNDQRRFRAVYQLTMEVSGWKVEGVSLLADQGIAV
jgi:hypothetical protein